MNVTVNGQRREFPQGTNIQTMLAAFELADERVAVEWNGRIVDRAAYADTVLAEGDTVEIVRFVGGG